MFVKFLSSIIIVLLISISVGIGNCADDKFFKVSGFGEKWSTTDFVLEGTWETLHLLDWGMTRDIKNHPGRYETNFILREHPSDTRIDIYMGSWAILHPVITDLVPKNITIAGEYNIPARTIFQGVSIGLSGGCVIKNFRLGFHVNF